MKYYMIFSNATIIFLSILLIGGISSLIREWIAKTYARSISYGMATFIDNRLTFIGVVHHELSHLILAILSGAKVKHFKLFQVKDGTLGHVDIIPRGNIFVRSLQLALCGIAPVLCGCVSLYLLYYNLINREYHDIWTIVGIILMMQISYHMSMSKQDFKAALKGLWLIYIILVVVTYFVKIDLVVYRGFIITILAILAINVIITLIIKLFAYIFKG